MSIETTRPDYVTTEHLEYLDELRELGATNMFGARPCLQAMFPELNPQTASQILSYWMQSFGKEDR